MGQSAGAFGVDLAALAQAEQGIRSVTDELSGMAWGGSGGAAEGAGFAEHVHSAAGELGHDKLQSALESFADRWEWGVRYLVDDGTDTAEALAETRATYEQVEDQVNQLVKGAAHLSLGDPMESSSEWQDKSWSQLGGELAPDYDLEPGGGR